MKYTNEQLKKLHKVELEILAEIDRICTNNNLNYYLDYGTLLGAVRHGGFIPWDDDIDISMPRKDYEIFIKLAPKKLKEGYVLQHYSTDKNVVAYHAKVRKEGTLFVEEAVRDIPICQGIFIDIFPCDKITENNVLRKIHYKKIKFIRTLFISKDLKASSKTQNKYLKILYSFIRGCLHLVCKLLSKDFLFRILDEAYRKYNNQDFKLMSEGTMKSTYMYSDIFPIKRIKFETGLFCVPNNPDTVLKQEYGEYMKLPPLSQRINHAPSMLEFEEGK